MYRLSLGAGCCLLALALEAGAQASPPVSHPDTVANRLGNQYLQRHHVAGGLSVGLYDNGKAYF